MLTITGCFLLMLCGYSMSASNRHCLPVYEGGSFCFTQPDPPVALSWSSAMQWCKRIGATLPIIDSYYHETVYQNAIGYLDLQAETLWLGANTTYDPDNWLWRNGSRFAGNIELSNISYQSHAYVMRNGSVLQFGATFPSEKNNFICRSGSSELECAGYRNSYWTNGKCYHKEIRRSWDSFVFNCEQSRCPLPYDWLELSRWLDNLVKFWIGLRCGWWTWHDIVTGRSFEVIENDAGIELPKIGYGECLASFINSDRFSSSSWVTMNCSSTLHFVCHQHVNKTSDKQVTRPTETINSERVATNGFFNNDPPIRASYWGSTGLATGLGVGLGGGLLLAICLVLFFVHVYRKNRAAKYSPVDLKKSSENNSNSTSRNAFDNYMFNVSSGTLERAVERRSSRNPYEPVNLKANEHVY